MTNTITTANTTHERIPMWVDSRLVYYFLNGNEGQLSESEAEAFDEALARFEKWGYELSFPSEEEMLEVDYDLEHGWELCELTHEYGNCSLMFADNWQSAR